MNYAARITGTGSAFPKTRMTNDDLVEKLARSGIETSHQWIVERTGICERRIAELENPAESNSSLGMKAAIEALAMAGKAPGDIDQIVYAERQNRHQCGSLWKHVQCYRPHSPR